MGFCQSCRAEVIAVAQPVRHKGMDGRAGAAQDTREHRGAALTVDVVVTVHQDRPAIAHGAHEDVQRLRHVGPGMRIGEALEIGTQERLGEPRLGQATLYQNRSERFGDP